ncbi:MAG: hypothetical protein ACXAEN_25735, partial [Candidatus Thorarchaeota archaeon]
MPLLTNHQLYIWRNRVDALLLEAYEMRMLANRKLHLYRRYATRHHLQDLATSSTMPTDAAISSTNAQGETDSTPETDGP